MKASAMLQHSAFSTQELAQEVLRWLKRDIPETVVAAVRVILTRYIETGEWKDDIGMMLGEQPMPPLSIQRFAVDRAAVQSETLVAATKACEQYLYGTSEFQHGVRTCIEAISALKREQKLS